MKTGKLFIDSICYNILYEKSFSYSQSSGINFDWNYSAYIPQKFEWDSFVFFSNKEINIDISKKYELNFLLKQDFWKLYSCYFVSINFEKEYELEYEIKFDRAVLEPASSESFLNDFKKKIIRERLDKNKKFHIYNHN